MAEEDRGREFQRQQREAAALHVAKLAAQLAEEKRRAAEAARAQKDGR